MDDLRHTFATILFDAGASAPDVQAVLGHSSLQVTERYSRAREGVARRAGSVLDGLFEPDRPKPKKNIKKSSTTNGAKKSRRSSASPNLADSFRDPFGGAGYSTGCGNGPRSRRARPVSAAIDPATARRMTGNGARDHSEATQTAA